MNIPNPIHPLDALKKALPEAVLDSKEFRGELTIVVDPLFITQVIQYLRDSSGLIYNFLSDISPVDYWNDQLTYDPDKRFGVSYHLYSMLYNRRLRIKVFLPEENPNLSTITPIFPGADWLEREAMDLMGVVFNGHHDKRRLLMPDDWSGHPHRRDYPLGYETVQFSFNVEDVLRHKPLAKE